MLHDTPKYLYAHREVPGSCSPDITLHCGSAYLHKTVNTTASYSQLQSKSTAPIRIKHTHRRCSFTACTALSKLPPLAPESRHGPGSHEAHKCKTPSPRAATRPPRPERFVQPLANSHANGSLIKPLSSRSNLKGKNPLLGLTLKGTVARFSLSLPASGCTSTDERLAHPQLRGRCHLACAPCGCDPAAGKRILPLKTFRR